MANEAQNSPLQGILIAFLSLYISFITPYKPFEKTTTKMTILKWISICLFTSIAMGVIAEQLAQTYFNTKSPDLENLYAVNGKPVHAIRKGIGGPTVVFQSGLGSDHKIWQEIQDSVSKFTTTLSYDRAGLLWSDTSNELRSLSSISGELIGLLRETGCPKPYILVGHSMAGITLRQFIQDHTND